MWDADAALLKASPLPQLAGAAPSAPTAQPTASSPLEPASCFDNPFLEHLRSPLQVHPWPNSLLGSMALPIMGHGTSATTQLHSWLATCLPPPTLLDHPILSTPEPSRNGTFGSTTCSSRLASSRPASDMSGAGMAEPLSNGIPGKEPVIYSGPQWYYEWLARYYEWLQSADNSTDGDTRHDLPWICEVDNAAAALCLDYIRRRGKGSCIRDELHWNYLFSNKNCARVWSVLSGIALPLGCLSLCLPIALPLGCLSLCLVAIAFAVGFSCASLYPITKWMCSISSSYANGLAIYAFASPQLSLPYPASFYSSSCRAARLPKSCDKAARGAPPGHCAPQAKFWGSVGSF